MQRKLSFPAFLVFLGLIAFSYFSYQLVSAFQDYFPKTAQAGAIISRWEVKEMGGEFALKAIYSFEIQGKIWNGVSVLAKPWYWNEPAAVASLKTIAQEKWEVWFDPKNPAHSSLQKTFPTGLLCRTILCFVIFIYFISVFRRICLA